MNNKGIFEEIPLHHYFEENIAELIEQGMGVWSMNQMLSLYITDPNAVIGVAKQIGITADEMIRTMEYAKTKIPVPQRTKNKHFFGARVKQ